MWVWVGVNVLVRNKKHRYIIRAVLYNELWRTCFIHVLLWVCIFSHWWNTYMYYYGRYGCVSSHTDETHTCITMDGMGVYLLTLMKHIHVLLWTVWVCIFSHWWNTYMYYYGRYGCVSSHTDETHTCITMDGMGVYLLTLTKHIHVLLWTVWVCIVSHWWNTYMYYYGRCGCVSFHTDETHTCITMDGVGVYRFTLMKHIHVLLWTVWVCIVSHWWNTYMYYYGRYGCVSSHTDETHTCITMDGMGVYRFTLMKHIHVLLWTVWVCIFSHWWNTYMYYYGRYGCVSSHTDQTHTCITMDGVGVYRFTLMKHIHVLLWTVWVCIVSHWWNTYMYYYGRYGCVSSHTDETHTCITMDGMGVYLLTLMKHIHVLLWTVWVCIFSHWWNTYMYYYGRYGCVSSHTDETHTCITMDGMGVYLLTLMKHIHVLLWTVWVCIFSHWWNTYMYYYGRYGCVSSHTDQTHTCITMDGVGVYRFTLMKHIHVLLWTVWVCIVSHWWNTYMYYYGRCGCVSFHTDETHTCITMDGVGVYLLTLIKHIHVLLWTVWVCIFSHWWNTYMYYYGRYGCVSSHTDETHTCITMDGMGVYLLTLMKHIHVLLWTVWVCIFSHWWNTYMYYYGRYGCVSSHTDETHTCITMDGKGVCLLTLMKHIHVLLWTVWVCIFSHWWNTYMYYYGR